MRTSLRAVAALAALALLTAACGSGGVSTNSPGGSAPTSAVRAQNNQALDTSVLVNRRGMTLYALSAETHGRFICTRSDLPGTTSPCISIWHPLLVGSGQHLGTSVSHLGTIHRPGDSEAQVTYKGMPLYTFAEDTAPGDVKGNGLKDVGTWRAATIGAASTGTAGGAGYGSY